MIVIVTWILWRPPRAVSISADRGYLAAALPAPGRMPGASWATSSLRWRLG
jgi:hypothetical protein